MFVIRALLLSGAIAYVPSVAAQMPHDTVQAGDMRVSGDRLTAAMHVMEMTIEAEGMSRPPVRMSESLERVTRGVRDVFMKITQIESRLYDTSYVEIDDLAPIEHRSVAPGARGMYLTFAGARVAGTHEPAGGEVDIVDANFEYRPFDSSLMNTVIAALPLEPGFQASIPFFVYEEGGIIWQDVEVSGSESVTLSEGSRDAWVVRSSGAYEFDLWIDKSTRSVLRSQATRTLPQGTMTIRTEVVR